MKDLQEASLYYASHLVSIGRLSAVIMFEDQVLIAPIHYIRQENVKSVHIDWKEDAAIIRVDQPLNQTELFK